MAALSTGNCTARATRDRDKRIRFRLETKCRYDRNIELEDRRCRVSGIQVALEDTATGFDAGKAGRGMNSTVT